MLCPNCKIPAAKENDFCKRCGAFVPRENSDVAKYTDFNTQGEGRYDKNSDGRKKSAAGNVGRQPFVLKELWESLNQSQSMTDHDTGANTSRKPSGGQAPYGSPYATPQSEPVYRRDTRQQVPGRTPTKKASPIPGLIILIGILLAMFIVPNILYGINYPDNVDYQENTVIASMQPEGEFLYEFHLKDVGITDVAMTEKYVESFVLSFLWDEQVKIDYAGVGYIQILNNDYINAFFDGTTVTVPNCILEFDTEYVLLYMSFYDTEKRCEYMFTFPEESNTLIFRKDGTYKLTEFTDPEGWY